MHRPIIRSSCLVCVGLLLLTTILLVAGNASAKEGFVKLDDTETEAVSMGTFAPGDLVEWGWHCEKPEEVMDFFISNGTHNFGDAKGIYGSQGTLNINSTMEYVMFFLSNYENKTVNVSYWYYTVKLDVTYGFSTQEAKRGQSVDLKVDISNSNENPIRITALGIHFDWMPDEVYQTETILETEPKYVSTGARVNFVIPYDVPEDAQSGLHVYDVLIEYEMEYDGNWTTYTWSTGHRFDFWVEDIDSDGDGVMDLADPFPDDPTEWEDTDGDGYGDDHQDEFPNDPNEWADANDNGIGDNEDEARKQAEMSKDTDSDGTNDYDDAFPNDRAAAVDSDGDGHPDKWNPGMSGKDSPSGLKLDHFPDNASKWEKEVKETNTGFVVIVVVAAIIAVVLIALIVFIMREKKKEKLSAEEEKEQPEEKAKSTKGTKKRSKKK